MFKVERLVEGAWYSWGTYETEKKAEETALYLEGFGYETRIVEVK